MQYWLATSEAPIIRRLDGLATGAARVVGLEGRATAAAAGHLGVDNIDLQVMDARKLGFPRDCFAGPTCLAKSVTPA